MTILEDKNLEKEFKRSMNNARQEYPTFNITQLPSPFKEVPIMVDYVCLKEVEDPILKSLENEYVKLIKKSNLQRFIYDEDNNLKKKVDYRTDKDSSVIATEKDLNVSKSRDIHTKKYNFIDFKIKDGVKEYYYEVPTSICYKVNLCYLVVSINKRNKNLGGEKVVLKNGYPVYLYVLPKRNSKLTEGYKVLAVKPSNDFSKEISHLKNFWRSKNIMFNDKSNFQVESLTKGDYNLVSEIYATDIEIPKIEPYALDSNGGKDEW